LPREKRPGDKYQKRAPLSTGGAGLGVNDAKLANDKVKLQKRTEKRKTERAEPIGR